MPDQLFSDNQMVRGITLSELMTWADCPDAAPPNQYGPIGLPAIQRSAVWNPKQILDFWDSALRGLPLGSFYLASRPENESAKSTNANAQLKMMPAGWNLLDGQQRLRALLTGWRGPTKDSVGADLKCIWVDLGPHSHDYVLSLYLTSNSQPFGYDQTNGQKLPKRDRTRARKKGDYCKVDAGRDAYDHELFHGLLKGSVTAGAGRNQPYLPSPEKASKGRVFPLHKLLALWRSLPNITAREAAQLRDDLLLLTGPANATSLDRLIQCFEKLDSAPIALIRVDQPAQHGGADMTPNDTLRLFDRIGSGGTRLSEEERLFAVYKTHVPQAHDIVAKIHEDHGHILSPSRICQIAIRIAHARTYTSSADGNYIISVIDFIRNYATIYNKNGRVSSIREQLDLLLPHVNDNESSVDGPLAAAFSLLISKLRFNDDAPLGLPNVMLASLSPNLIEVLVLAIMMNPKAAGRSDTFWPDATRFALMWPLCVTEENHGTAVCFARLRANTKPSLIFHDLYLALCEMGAKAIIPLITSDMMDTILRLPGGGHDPQRTFAAGMPTFTAAPGSKIDTAAYGLAWRWWSSSGQGLLRWFEREYLNKMYQDFNPAFRSDEDTPYDIDHMVAQHAWNFTWSGYRERGILTAGVPQSDVIAFREGRKTLGEAVGNKWLIDAGINRRAGNISLREKVGMFGEVETQFLMRAAGPTDEEMGELDELESAENQGVAWDGDKMLRFQGFVVARTGVLYKRFLNLLSLDKWASDQIVDETRQPDSA